MGFLINREIEVASVEKYARTLTPEIDQNVLASFDSTRQKIYKLIVRKEDEVDLASQSKPVRESLKANFGVSYVENVNTGGAFNVKIKGKSYYDVPGRNMKREELERKQQQEQATKVVDVCSSHIGDVASEG